MKHSHRRLEFERLPAVERQLGSLFAEGHRLREFMRDRNHRCPAGVVMRMKAVSLLLVITLMCVAGCDDDDDGSSSGDQRIKPKVAPWSLPLPTGWDVSTAQLLPGPRSKVGVLRTWTSNVPRAWEFADPGPNSASGATSALGDDAAVVILSLFWEPSRLSLWNPTTQASLTKQAPSRWHDDAQNFGWKFRERKLSLGEECMSIIEWHGPSTSRIENDRAAQVASSVRLLKTEFPID